MRYFIPSWYVSEDFWKNGGVPFHHTSNQTDFDDMISLMSMHMKNNEDFQMIILNYSPQLRLFLHRYNLFESEYFSLFDYLQNANHQLPKAINFLDLDWPKHTEFVYSPFMVEAIIDKDTYSLISFNQEGYILYIDEFQYGEKIQRMFFDDRGFISSILKYRSNSPYKQFYLTTSGDVVLVENLITGKVNVTEKLNRKLQRFNYPSMKDVINELICNFNHSHITENDDILVAADERHNQIIINNFLKNQVCFSIFSQRNNHISHKLIDTLLSAKSCIVDTLKLESKINELISKRDKKVKIKRITPFDAEKISNNSFQLNETYIGFWTSGLSEEEIELTIDYIYEYIKSKENFKLIILTKNILSNTPQWLLNKVKKKNISYNEENNSMSTEMTDILNEEINFTELIKIEPIISEIDLLKIVSKMRAIIDLSDEPDLYLQISCISSGVPQINKVPTDYVIPNINGIIINDFNKILSSLDFFIDSLKHWNYSYAYSIKLIDLYSSSEIIKQLNYLIKGDYYD